MLLMVVVLFAQWMGMRHRIEHAGWINDRPAVMQIAEQTADEAQPDNGKAHSCRLFDDATLAATVTTLPFVLPLQINVRVLALWLAFTSWDAPLTHFFFSRAPPPAQ